MKKKHRNPVKPKRQTFEPQSPTWRPTRWVAVFAVMGAASFFYYLMNAPSQRAPAEARVSPPSAGTSVEAHQELPPFHADPENAKPFPVTLDPSRFSIPFVSRAYAIAREMPEVLAQQHCYCNCGVFGHGSLLDCFASDHGAACTVCLKEAFLAEEMTQSEKTPQEIRAAITKGFWRLVELESP